MTGHDNPLGTDGFEFIEFTSAEPASLEKSLENLGFICVGHHKHKNVRLYKQNDINFIVNAEDHCQASEYANQHGPSANAVAFRVRDAAHAIQQAEARGATVVHQQVGPMELNIPAIKGVGNSLIYFVDRYDKASIYDVDFDLDTKKFSNATGDLRAIDHVTQNLHRGNVQKYAQFYEQIFNFRETRRFEIHGVKTGLVSRVMTSPCDKISMPINESADDESQIEEFLSKYRGEGIQHIALSTHNIVSTVSSLRRYGIDFQETPATYYDALPERVKGFDMEPSALKEQQILLDGSPNEGYLLQIFTRDFVGPMFFEIIERKGNTGFGEGNFQALFDSIERNQIERGVISEHH